MRSGEKARKRLSPTLAPRASKSGRRSSSVVPGYVVDSRTTSWTGRNRGYLLRRDNHEGDVGVLGLPERRRHADHDDVALLEHGEVRCRAVAPFGGEASDLVACHVADIRAMLRECRDPLGVGVQAGDGEARAS